MSTAALTPPAAVGAPSVATGDCLGSGPADRTFNVTALDVNIAINRCADQTAQDFYKIARRQFAL